MSAPPFNPYAPPQSPPFAYPPGQYPQAPLPEGVRRFRLDPATYRVYAMRAFRQRSAVLLTALVMAGLILAALMGPWGAYPFALPILAVAVYSVFSGWRRARNPNAPELLSYELLVSPRVLRRSIAGVVTAEVLRPEVTTILETPDGLWVSSQTQPRSLFVARSIDGYADVRASLEPWGKFEPLTGRAGRRRAVLESKRQGPRDAIIGTALATDPSLSQELAMVRGASTAPWTTFPKVIPVKRVVWRAILLWALLIVMFLAIWQFLSPSERSPQEHPRPPRTTEPE